MVANDLTPDEQARFDSLYGADPAAAAPDSPGIFAGAYKGAAGIPSGLAGVPLSIASAVTNAPAGAEDDPTLAILFGGSGATTFHPYIEQARQSAADFYRPDPQTTGFVGNTLFGVTDLLTRIGVSNLVAPGTGLAVAAGTTGYERTQDLEAQGVDPITAQGSGLLTGGSLLAMGGVTSFGQTALQRVITGGATNVTFGAGTRGLDSALLASHGYTAQAEQQKWSDGSAILADLVIGSAFGLMPHTKTESLPADVVDAALTSKSAQQVTDLAPGAPADARSAGAHVDALDTAQTQLMDGQPVQVDPIVREATFVPREGALEDGLHEALTNSGIPAEALAEPAPSAADALRQRLEGDPEKLFADYAALPDSQGGRILNTDTARELSPEYLADRTRSADVHEPASEVIKQLYAQKLAEPTPEGMDPVVRFTAGGTGAGKSVGLSGLDGASHPEIIYDTNMNTLASAEKKIDQALGAGRTVQIVYTFRDPVDALVGGALPRAERQALKYGTGRTVPLGEHLRTHVGSLNVMHELAKRFQGDPRVDLQVIDNSHGKGNQRPSSLADLPHLDETSLHEKLQAALQQEHQAGRISDATFAGFSAKSRRLGEPVRGEPEAQRAAGTRGRPGNAAARGEGQQDAGAVAGDAAAGNPEAGTRSESQARRLSASDAADPQAAAGADGASPDAGRPQQGAAGADAQDQQRTGLDPARDGEVERARVAAAAHPDAVLDDGTTTADALRAADDDVHQAETQGEAIQAAIACFLRFGSEA